MVDLRNTQKAFYVHDSTKLNIRNSNCFMRDEMVDFSKFGHKYCFKLLAAAAYCNTS